MKTRIIKEKINFFKKSITNDMKSRKRIVDLFLIGGTLLWIIIMMILLFLPGNQIDISLAKNMDKVIHFFLYGIFSILIFGCIYIYRKKVSIFHNSSFTIMLGSGCGITSELLQSFIPGRSISGGDAAADVAGVIAGIIAGKVMSTFFKSTPGRL
ncbi:MAG: VanZ family protein [Candidatus Omnitrophota bacterium]